MSSKGTVLVVEDDNDLAAILYAALLKESYTINVAGNGREALHRLEQFTPDFILTDIMMPEMDGLTLCRLLRADSLYNDTIIIFLSSLDRTDDIVAGLEAGADDYLGKPIPIRELQARMRAMQRIRQRFGQGQRNQNLMLYNVNFDPLARQVETPYKSTYLTAMESKLLHQLMQHPDTPHSLEALLQTVWSYPIGTGDPDLVRAHIRKLRLKMEQDPENPHFIQTVYGIGYKFASPPL
jgi:DNA-binding response OmpR family regulator